MHNSAGRVKTMKKEVQHVVPLFVVVAVSLYLATQSTVVSADSRYAPTCTNWTNCDNATCGIFEFGNDMIAFLGDRSDKPAFAQFYQSFGKAVSILRSYPGVVTDDYYIPHLTLQCAHSSNLCLPGAPRRLTFLLVGLPQTCAA